MFSIHRDSCIQLWRNRKNSQRISKIKLFIDKCDWEGINYSSGKDDRKKFEINYPVIANNALYAKNEEIYTAYASKHNPNREGQIIL